MDGPAPAIVNAVEDALKAGSTRFRCFRRIFSEALASAATHKSRADRDDDSGERRWGCAVSLLSRQWRTQDCAVYPVEEVLDPLRERHGIDGREEAAGRRVRLVFEC
jgi:hypothetical protein